VRFYLAHLPRPLPLTPEQPTFSEARWATPREALALLTWDNEKCIVRRALAHLEQD
jgi:hypothetical protein